MIKKQAQDIIDFIVKKSKMYDTGIFVYVGEMDTLKERKHLYELWASLKSYEYLRADLSYDHGRMIEITSKMSPETFEKTAYRIALKKILSISAKGYDIFCESALVLKKNTTLEKLLIDKDLALNDKE